MFEEESQHLLSSIHCHPSSVGKKKKGEEERRREERERKEEIEKRGEKTEEGRGRRQTETDGQKYKCGKTAGKRELKGAGEEMEGIE